MRMWDESSEWGERVLNALEARTGEVAAECNSQTLANILWAYAMCSTCSYVLLTRDEGSTDKRGFPIVHKMDVWRQS